jgi:hypothetical protein
MTQEQFAAQVEALVTEARHEGLSDEVMIKVLEDAVEVLDVGLP